MSKQKSIFTYIGQALEQYHADHRADSAESQVAAPRRHPIGRVLRWLIPNGGTLLIVAILLLTQSLWARPFQATTNAPGPSATTINYQGRLADNAGASLDGSYGMSFALYDAATDGNMVWGPEAHTAVPVSDGLFSVGLGSQTSGGIPTSAWNGDRYLEITVAGETLAPRELIRSVPIAGMALTVPDGAIGSEQIADGAITQSDAPFAPLTYWFAVDNTPDSNMKTAIATFVFNPEGETSRQINISDYGFTTTPLGVCEISATSDVVRAYFCAYRFTSSDANIATISIHRYDGGTSGLNGAMRITLFLMGK